MEPFFASFLAGVLANVLTNLTLQAGRRATPHWAQKRVKDDPEILRILAEGIQSDALEEFKGERMKAFMSSAAVETVVRQIYAGRLLDEEEGYLDPIREEFTAALEIYLEIASDRAVGLGERLFRTLVDASSKALAAAIDEGVLAAHEAKSTMRFRLLRSELVGLKNTIKFLAEHKGDLVSTREFELAYLRVVEQLHASITPPHLDSLRKVPIDKLYVSPSFVVGNKRESKLMEEVRGDELVRRIHRTVVLGNPGGGKSTFANKVTFDLACEGTNNGGARRLIPFLVLLRDYGVERKAHPVSILKFIEMMTNAKYQTEAKPGVVEYYLLSGSALVIFDGLDELLDTTARRDIAADIEGFCARYPAAAVLVTSRKVGYDQAPLDERMFELCQLADFDDEQVAEYVEKWFAVDEEMLAADRDRSVRGFLEESAIVPDLRSNALMLALMCTIYRGENYIPRNRPDVYEKCSTMLFQRWDKMRGIEVALKIEYHIESAMQSLAQWIYCDPSLQSGATEAQLVDKTTEYLREKQFEDDEQARAAAQDFIEFCRGRAWVFTDTGTTAEGEKIYQFTHRTFLEYFTAVHLVRTNPSPGALLDILLPRIARQEWDVVAQLAFQIQSKHVEGAADELLNLLLEQVARTRSGVAKLNLLLFAARALAFLVPVPRTTRAVARSGTEGSMSAAGRKLRRGRSRSVFCAGVEVMGGLIFAAKENQDAVADEIRNILIDRINSKDEEVASRAIEIAANLAICTISGFGRARQDLIESWDAISREILKECRERVVTLAEGNLSLALEAYGQEVMSLTDVVHKHGMSGAFAEPNYVWMLPNVEKNGIAYGLLMSYMGYPQGLYLKRETVVKDLEEMGDLALSSDPPFTDRRGHGWLQFYLQKVDQSRHHPSLSAAGVFGLGVVLLTLVEGEGEQELAKVLDSSGTQQADPIERFRATIRARFDTGDIRETEAQKEWRTAGLSEKQMEFLSRWVRKEIDLVSR